jgi:uncharacterized protein with HEPN domain
LPSRHDPADSLHHIIENAERVCKAAVRLGDQAEALMPGQPWADIRGMGNRLRHAYDRVDVDIIWRTATKRLPELAAAAERALAQLERAKGSP